MKFNYSAFKAIYLHEMDRFRRTLIAIFAYHQFYLPLFILLYLGLSLVVMLKKLMELVMAHISFQVY